MKIGFDAKRAFHNTTGLGNYSRDLISILVNKYSKNNYFLYNPKPKKVDRLKEHPALIEIQPKSSFWKKLSSIWRLKNILKQIQDDDIEIYHGLSGELPLGIAKTKIKSVVTIHDLIFLRLPKFYSFFDRKIHFLKFKYAANKADKVIAISEQTKQDIVNFLKIDASKIEVVYQGCHTVFKEVSSEEEKIILRKKYKLPEKFVLNVGTIEERKNALTIVKAVKEIDTYLVIVGRKTKYYDKVKLYIEEHNLTEKVIFLEGMTLKELSTLYQCADIFIYPSMFEGFGIPIIEALYSKTPVITTKGGVFPEAGGPSSMYVTKDNIEELTSCILKILSDEDLKDKMITEGYSFVQKFNDETIGEEIMTIYKDILHE